jgi:hypothetical protein
MIVRRGIGLSFWKDNAVYKEAGFKPRWGGGAERYKRNRLPDLRLRAKKNLRSAASEVFQ